MIVHTCQIPPALVTSYLDQSLNDKKHAILELQINILQGNLSLILPLQVWNQGNLGWVLWNFCFAYIFCFVLSTSEFIYCTNSYIWRWCSQLKFNTIADSFPISRIRSELCLWKLNQYHFYLFNETIHFN